MVLIDSTHATASQVGDATYNHVAVSARPLRTMTLVNGRGAPLAQLMARMLPQVVRPLQRLELMSQPLPAAELVACAPALAHLQELSFKACAPDAPEQLLPLAPSLTALEIRRPTSEASLPQAVLDHTGLHSLTLEGLEMGPLPLAPYLTGAVAAAAAACWFRVLSCGPARLHACELGPVGTAVASGTPA